MSHVRRSGFTLIEVLVVVAIIALLVAILIPSLNEAREQARVAKCVANLKALAVATTAYLTNNRDRFPWAPARHNAADGPFYESKPPTIAYSNYYGGKRGIGDPPSGPLHTYYRQGGTYDFFAWERPMNRYVTSAKLGKNADLPVYSCPSERPGHGGGIASRNNFGVKRSQTSAYDACGTSYQSNVTWYAYTGAEYGEGLSGTERSKRVGRLMDRIIPLFEKLGPARAIILHEDPSDCALGGILGTSYPLDWKVPGWHQKLGRHTMSFLDGHAAYMLIEAKFNRDHSTKDPGFTPCYSTATQKCANGRAGWVARQDYMQE